MEDSYLHIFQIIYIVHLLDASLMCPPILHLASSEPYSTTTTTSLMCVCAEQSLACLSSSVLTLSHCCVLCSSEIQQIDLVCAVCDS